MYHSISTTLQREAKKNGFHTVPDTESDGEEEVEDIFEGLSVVQLKAHCRRRQLRRAGTKSELLSRLREYEQELMEAEAGEDDSESIEESDDRFEEDDE